jgi:hypothetical protein
MDSDWEQDALREQHEALRDQQEALRLQFVSTELDLAITFFEIAISSHDPDKAYRNAANARRAYEAASQRLGTSPAGSGSNPEIDGKLRRLQKLLAKLDKNPGT